MKIECRHDHGGPNRIDGPGNHLSGRCENLAAVGRNTAVTVTVDVVHHCARPSRSFRLLAV